jgi:serine phosphatase RsbU (regulator of sigma subunit)
MTDPKDNPPPAGDARPRPRGLSVFLSSLRTKAALVAVAFVLVLVAGIGFIIIRHEKLALTREVELRILAQARSLATSSERIMLEPDPELTFQKLLRETMARNSDILAVVVVDRRGAVLAHPEVTKIGKPYTAPPGLIPVRDEKVLAAGETLAEGENDFLVSTPITRTYEGRRLTIGRVYIRSSKEKVVAAVDSAARQVTTIAVIVSLLGSVAAVILSGFITTPVKKLAEGARRIGEGDLAVRVDVAGRDEIGQLSHTLNEMACRLSAARSDLVEKERMAKELEIARDIQQSLLPQDFAGLDTVDVAAACQSATEVGGDYFDLIPIDRRRVGIVMADVAGKGVPGLLVMGVARSVIRGQARQHLSPREVLIRANDLISPDIHRGMFVTVLYGVVDVERRVLVVANAGHNPLIILKGTGPVPYDILKTQGRPVGFMVGPFFDDRLEESTVVLDEGDVIFTYTDGVLDALNADGEEFGMNRLLELLETKRGAPVQEIVDGVLAALAAFVGAQPQNDDITVLAVALRPSGAAAEVPPAAGEEPKSEETAPADA